MTALGLHIILAAIAVDSLFTSIPRGEPHLLTGLLKKIIYLKGEWKVNNNSSLKILLVVQVLPLFLV